MTNSTEGNVVLDWLANGGRLRIVRELKTNGGQTFAIGETVKLLRLEPALVDHSYVGIFESELEAGKIIRIRETLFDAVTPIGL